MVAKLKHLPEIVAAKEVLIAELMKEIPPLEKEVDGLKSIVLQARENVKSEAKKDTKSETNTDEIKGQIKLLEKELDAEILKNNKELKQQEECLEKVMNEFKDLHHVSHDILER